MGLTAGELGEEASEEGGLVPGRGVAASLTCGAGFSALLGGTVQVRDVGFGELLRDRRVHGESPALRPPAVWRRLAGEHESGRSGLKPV